MEKPPFLRVMTIAMVILLAILVAFSLWMFRTDSSGYAIFYVVPQVLYLFFFCLMVNLLGYNIYIRKTKRELLFVLLLPFLFFFLILIPQHYLNFGLETLVCWDVYRKYQCYFWVFMYLYILNYGRY